MNNPFQIMQALQNPQQFVAEIMKDQRMSNDPRIRRTSELIARRDTEGLKTLAENLCREYGTTPEQVRQMLNL